MPPVLPPSPDRRDRAVARVRALGWATATGVTALSAVLSVVAAQAFRGRDGRRPATATAGRVRTAPATPRVVVPPAQPVPAISAAPAPLAPPAAAPAPAAPPTAAVPQQQPPVQSGGS